MHHSEDSLYQVWLSLIPGIGGSHAKSLISYMGSAKNVFDASSPKIQKVPGIGQKIAFSIQEAKKSIDQATKEIEQAEKKNINILLYTDQEYPAKLKHCRDAPYMLYYQGKADLNMKKVVSIVGTRRSTAYGQSVTEDIVKALSQHKNILIVSGLAYGIDIHAHRAALKYDVPTIGIMANGLNHVYPAVHKKTAYQMLEKGGLISENSLDSIADAPKFPARNRIIAGMADLTIVVEAQKKGGALITAGLANDYDREVFAIPGRLGEPSAEGCHALIKNHQAHIFTSTDEMFKMMNWDKSTQVVQKSLFEKAEMSSNEEKIYDLIQKGSTHFDDLAILSNSSMNQLASLLLEMELKGILKAIGGNRYTIKC